MYERLLVAIVLTGTLFAGGCGSSDSDSSSANSTGAIQLINGMSDSPTLSAEVLDDDDVVETIPALSFQDATVLAAFARGSYGIEIFFEDPESGFEERLLTSELDVSQNSIYYGIVNGTFNNPQITWLEQPESDATDADSDEFEVRVLNLSSESVSVFLGDDEEGLAIDNLVGTLAAGSASDPLSFSYDDNAEYHLRVVEEATGEIVYDSDEILIVESNRYFLIITEPTGPDLNTKSAFVVTDSGASSFPNTLAQSSFVSINAVADAGNVETNVEVSATGEELVVTTLSYRESSASTTSDANFVDVFAVADIDPTITYTTTVSLNEDTAYSFTIAGSAFDEDVSIRANERDLRRVANAVNVHIINTLRETDDEDSSAVDFYALRLGDALSDTAPIGSGIEFLEGVSAIIGATPYDLVVTTSGTQSILAGPTRIFPEGNERMILVASEASGGGLPYQLVVISID